MRYYAQPLSQLIGQLSKLPGVGPKTAQRLAFHILEMDQNEAKVLAKSISEIKEKLTYCSICNNLTQNDPCYICSDLKRDKSLICVIEEVKDIIAMEKTGEYKGLYHALCHSE